VTEYARLTGLGLSTARLLDNRAVVCGGRPVPGWGQGRMSSRLSGTVP